MLIKKKRGLYIHIPFCKKKCYYCDFASKIPKSDEISQYLKAIDIEMEMYNIKEENIYTIFIGGGTPSLLSPEELEILFRTINKYINIDEIEEYTIECNPGTLDRDKLKVMKKYGVNRLSIGLQAVQDRHLKFMGRIHNIKEFDDNFILARELGFDNINVDIIFAFEGQSIDDLEETIDHIIYLEPEHISAYSLIIEENTAFYDMYLKKELNDIDDDLYVKMYRLLVSKLSDKGYEQYEISNYSKEGKECKHNLNYWDCGEYFGIGLSSSGYVNGIRYTNTKLLEEYVKTIIELKEKPIDYKEKLTNIDIYNEKIMLSLRTNKGIDIMNINDIKEKYINYEFYDKIIVIEERISTFISEGMMVENCGRLALTQEGREISNSIIVDLML